MSEHTHLSEDELDEAAEAHLEGGALPDCEQCAAEVGELASYLLTARASAGQRAELEARGHGPNAALMIGHNTIRAMALGEDFMRPSTPAEVERMTEMVEQGMAEGAYGLSAGLEYVPGIWSETSELFPLVEENVTLGGFGIARAEWR